MKIIYGSYELPESEFLKRIKRITDDKVTRITKHIDEKLKGGIPVGELYAFCAKTKTEPKFKCGDLVKIVFSNMCDDTELYRVEKIREFDVIHGYVYELKIIESKYRICIGNKTLALESQLELKPCSKFEIGMEVKVISNISSSLIGLIGTIKTMHFENGKYRYLVDFRKTQNWRDLTWIYENELEWYHESKTEKLLKNNEKLQTSLADAHYELGKVKRMSIFEFVKWRRK